MSATTLGLCIEVNVMVFSSKNATFSYHNRQSRGFSLIELMVAVAIVAILAAIAYPSYLTYLIKTRRTAAQSYLMDIAQRQQQYLLDARSYAANTTDLSLTAPNDVSPYYTITMASSNGPPPTFTATATPITGTTQAGDVTLSIDNAGAKTPVNTW